MPNPRDLDPVVIAQELLAWCQDDGRWDPRAAKDWQSLLDDVDAAWSRLGPRLTHVCNVGTRLAVLREVRDSGTSLVTSRQAVEDAAHVLETAFDGPAALSAAVDDLFEAAKRNTNPGSLDDETSWYLVLFASVSERHGHDWAITADRFRRALEWTRQQPLDESIEAVHKAIDTAPEHGRSIVWLAIDHAYAWGQPPSPAIELFDGDWLLAVLRNWDGPRDGVPPELSANPKCLPEACSRIDEDAHPNEQLPVSFARIDLGEGPTAGARDRARETLELLVARASARLGSTTWKISGPVLHFVDEELIFEAVGSVGDPDIYTRLDRKDVVQDPTAKTVVDEAQRLYAHIPVRDGRLHDALQLSKWLSGARESSPPARLVLSGRIIEQTANWAGLKPRSLIEDHLSWAWARNTIAADLAKGGYYGILRLPVSERQAAGNKFREVWREIIAEPAGQTRVRTLAVLTHLDWLVEQHSATTETGDHLRELQRRVANGATVTEWIEKLRGELITHNARAVRTRNALVHGGPLVTAVANSVVELMDDLGSQALEWVIDGLAAESPVPQVFADHRKRYIDVIDGLSGCGTQEVELSELLKLP